jgi:uncharacterized damage-inducible protein DinB
MHGYGPTELAKAFRTVRKNTVQVAEDIPEDKYDFIPAPGVKSVRDQLAHIALSPMVRDDMHRVRRLTTLAGYDFGEISARMRAEEQKPRTRAQLIELLKTEGEKFAKWLESLKPEFLAETFTDRSGAVSTTRFESLLGVKEHEMHHRGQLMLIERQLGIVPHLTRERQALQPQPAAR